MESGAQGAGISWQRNLYVLWVAETLTILGFCLAYPFLPFYLVELGAESFESRALWAGAMSAASAGFMAITAPFWGMAADRWGRKPMVVRAMLCGAVTTGLMGLVVAPWQLLVLFILDGAFSGTVAAAMTMVAATTPRERLGYAMGLLQTAIFTGFSLGPLIGGVLADQIGYRPVFGIGAALLFLAAGLVITQTREVFTPARRSAGVEAARVLPLKVILMVGALPAAVGIMLALRATTGAMQPLLPLFVEDLAAPGARVATLAGLTFGVSGVGSAVASLVIGRASDRIGHRLVLIVACFSVAALFLPLALAQSPWQLIVCYGLLGVATGGIIPSAQAVVADLTPPERRGVVFGVTSAAASFGGFIGPLGGSLLATTIDLRFVFVASAAVMLVAAVWVTLALNAARAVVASAPEEPPASPISTGP
ncbi:MAG TPA: MFS transporter [Thermomicrobiales bacterium]|nr:MFS transporter [Thermomicrobiales bacterium]